VGLKMDFYNTGPREVTAEYTVPERYQGYPGVVHGGITAAMLDETAGRSVIADGNKDQFFMTMKLEIKYRQPVPVETPLKIVGQLTSRKGRRATARGEIRLPDDSVAAEAEVLLALMPPERFEAADLEALGWQVYDE